jgi:primosomal protein N' (replication factor Y) (superfamily II helicase)
MPQFCNVALPVPLDGTFTYRLDGTQPVIGGRVLVPFRDKRLPGIVTALHDDEPPVKARLVLSVLDATPVLDRSLIELGEWISHYYIAPLGEVFRTMLPLSAEFRRMRGLRITDAGLAALAKSAQLGAIEAQALEIEILDYLSSREELVREATLRSATGVGADDVRALLRRKWIVAEDMSASRDAARTVQVVVLREVTGKLNANQQAIVDALTAAGSRLRVDQLRELDVPRTTLGTLVKRGVVEIEQQPADFHVSSVRKASPLGFIFNPAQKRALDHIERAAREKKFSSTLLHGVTGSGKTAVYLAAMQSVLRDGRGAILLVPEIGLTPAAAAQLHQVFAEEVAILHSGLTADERAEQWHRIRRGEAKIVVGTRSAVFAPVAELALIIVDEEHDPSYKQDETPRYHARDVAIMRAKFNSAAVVLGSATPSLESYHNAQRGKYTLLEMPDRVEHRPLPEVELIDMKAEYRETGHQNVISRKLGEEIAARLERGEQSIILLNRRGFSPFVLCRTCGETVQCRDCAVAMTYHKSSRQMECHYCGFSDKAPQLCPKCGSEYVQFMGTGSEKLEELLHSMFPSARIARLDRDTVRGRQDFERALNALHAGEIDIVVGTQMIAKGHDIHGVTLVGVVAADTALAFPDFRSAERTFQLLTQVAGRAGRGESPGKVVLQTCFPDHYAVQFAAHHAFSPFYEKELRYRSWMHYPPFTAIANVLIRSDRMEDALRYSGLLGRWFQSTKHDGVRVLGPAPSPITRLKGEYRYHLVLKSDSRARINAALRAMLEHAAEHKIPRSAITADVDALSLL